MQRPALLQAAIDRGVSNPPGQSILHGDGHWKAVALTGLEIVRRTPGADPKFMLAFGLLHDIMRESDGHDPRHGQRAAILFQSLCGDPGLRGFARDGKRSAAMRYALGYHNRGVRRADGHDLNVGICWDADRLNLPRVGIEPDARFLTTSAARTTELREYACGLCDPQAAGALLPSWAEILERKRELT